MKKRLLSILLVLLTALTLLPLGALADDNNKCGENLTWEFKGGTLSIDGTGEMYDYSEDYLAPWSEHCVEITNVTISDGVTSIGSSAFCYCSVKSITLPFGLKHIGASAFFYCPNIQQIKIPDSVEHIDPYAFSFCKGLHTVQLPSSLTLISEELFAECDNLKNLSIPDTVTEIGANAFLRCTAFILEKLPAGIKSIGAAAFANCGNIESLALPGTLESIGEAAFGGTIIDKASFDGTLEKWKAIGGDGCGIAQDKIDFLEHTCDFSGWKYDEHKHWQQCACGKTQNEGAHTGTGKTCDVCGAVLSEALGSGSIDGGLSWSLSRSGALTITKLEALTFSGCASLAEIALPDGLKALGEKVFSGCAALKSVKIPAEVTVIPTEAFSGCSSLESITIPKSVSHINEHAFDGCTALKKVDYLGSDTDWSQVTKETGNNVLDNAEKSFTRTDHEHKYTDTVIPPTCTERGCTVHLCACGDKREDSYTPPLGHSYRDGICVRCGILDPNGDTQHKHDFIPSVTKPTCLTEGFTTYACSCGECYTKDYVSAVGHKTQLQNAKAAGCMTGGYTGDEVCTFCGKVFKQGSVIFALGHDPQPARVKAPTCNESGYTGDLICMRCGDMTQIGNTVAAAGHKFFGGVCSVCGAKGAEAAPEFDDVKPGAFYFDAVQWAVKNGITNGTGKSTFSPNDVCSRYQIVMFLWRAAGQPEAKAAVSFADVKPGDIFYEAVQWAVERGITNGTSSTSFSPFAPCTRGQIVTFLYRSAGSPKVSGACDFSDVSAGSFCHDAVIWASSEGITKGTSAGRFSPNEGCTRAQVVTFLYRASGGK